MNDKKQRIGVVGLGLMGSSIVTCILAAGHEVIGYVQEINRAGEIRQRIAGYLRQMQDENLLKKDPEIILQQLEIVDKYAAFTGLEVVIESIVEHITAKKEVYRELEEVLPATAIISSNTSAIPVSALQAGMKHPGRLLGVHWAEPAHITRFMEVICGDASELKYAEKIKELAITWGKEPSLLKKDIRGFITNRLFYAMLREAFYLVENGYAEMEDIDRSLRNDLGYWITFAGPFRFMDLTGIPAYLTVMEDLFPALSTSPKPSMLLKKLVDAGAKGTANAHGFYPYTEKTAEQWEKLFIDFSYEIRKLASKYPENIGEKLPE